MINRRNLIGAGLLGAGGAATALQILSVPPTSPHLPFPVIADASTW